MLRIVPWLSLVIATLALVIAAVAIYQAGARVRVGIWKSFSTGGADGSPHTFVVVIHNSGLRPITIRDVGLVAAAPAAGQVWATRERARQQDVGGPDLPYRLGGVDSAEWTFSGALATNAFGATARVLAYADLVRIAERRWRRGSPRAVATASSRVASRWSELNTTP